MNEVNARRARLQLGWVTVFKRVYHLDGVSTFHNDDFCEARLTMLCSGCLELTTENCR